MSKNTSTGYADTAISGVTAPSVTLPIINFSDDYRVKSESTSEVILCNITTPLDQPATIRYGYSEIANIYKNSSINSDFISGPRKGANLLAQITETVKVTDSVDASFSQYLPVSAHLVLKVPQSAYIDSTQMQRIIQRLLATLYTNGVPNLPALLKGVIKPKEL